MNSYKSSLVHIKSSWRQSNEVSVAYLRVTILTRVWESPFLVSETPQITRLTGGRWREEVDFVLIGGVSREEGRRGEERRVWREIGGEEEGCGEVVRRRGKEWREGKRLEVGRKGREKGSWGREERRGVEVGRREGEWREGWREERREGTEEGRNIRVI